VGSIAATHEWNLPDAPGPEADALARETGLPRLLAGVLLRRGLSSPQTVDEFIAPHAALLHSPAALPDIAPATSRILAAVRDREPVLVYGDYDTDGVTGTALLVSTLRSLGAGVLAYLPHREAEGYGLSLNGVTHARDNGCRLIVTVDCGVADFESVAAARAAGIDVVVTDHHEPRKAGRIQRSDAGGRLSDVPDELPDALAVVDPKRADSAYPFSELAGCGVAFKLAWSLFKVAGRSSADLTPVLDLVGLGTIADVVPLLGENRVIARLGLRNIRLSRRPGIQALLEVAGLRGRELTSRDVGFGLAPRINAAGRVGHADLALRLLLTADPAEATAIARELDGLNRSRQSIEESILAAATARIEEGRLHEQRVMVVPGEGWHEGVIGIVASKLVDRYYRPCVVVALKADRGKGSARSVTGFDLHAALSACSGHLLGFGGHRYAAGLQVSRDRLAPLAAALNEYAAGLPDAVFQPTLHVEAVAGLEEIDDALLGFLARFEPFGPDNPEPLFASLGIEVVGCPRRVGRDHLKFSVRSGGTVLPAIAWGRSSALLDIEVGRRHHLDVCYSVRQDSFRGRRRTELEILDLRTSSAGGPAT